ncbi:Outer membrane lipoprotein-sorting protein [Fodinibius roseus]|uniref:Outer membrane lipoprotein-sorting protein n=1 Tax=Fodinibius roseus TaxID=1194090 RepID=A0A1M5AGR8_9BACT|nr:outer-membrane lipoprotein carrier protein LolA [Fodinibius roseus]SHF29345.1 Outer membrane lipoprotein-sorting protein [Fodinibius roseus]
MNWTNSIANLLRVLACTIFLLGVTKPLLAQENPFSQLKEKFENGQIFSADFQHRSVDSYTGDTVSSDGWIWVGREQYKVRADHQSVVVNGKTSMVYDNNRNRVIISTYEPSEDDFAPSRILNGIDSTFSVEAEERREDQFYIRLTSDDTFAIYKKVEIFLSSDLIPLKIRAVDPVDNVITTQFNDGKFVPARQEMFHLDYPEGAEVVDMRN